MHKLNVLRPPQAAAYLSISLRQLYRISETDPLFPRKIVFSSRCVGWRREDLDTFLQAKVKEVA